MLFWLLFQALSSRLFTTTLQSKETICSHLRNRILLLQVFFYPQTFLGCCKGLRKFLTTVNTTKQILVAINDSDFFRRKIVLFFDRSFEHLIKCLSRFIAASWLYYHPNEPIPLSCEVESRTDSLLLSVLLFGSQRCNYMPHCSFDQMVLSGKKRAITCRISSHFARKHLQNFQVFK